MPQKATRLCGRRTLPLVAWAQLGVPGDEGVEEDAREPGEDLFACRELREWSGKWLGTEHEDIEHGTAVDDGTSEVPRNLFGQQ